MAEVGQMTIRMIRKTLPAILVTALMCGVSLAAPGAPGPEPNVVLSNAMAKIGHDASMNPESAMVLAELLQKEFGTSDSELRWGIEEKMGWGEIAALAYIQATTGKSFAAMNDEDAGRNFWSYAEKAGMSCEKMARWFGGFQKRVERERNSRIFDRLRGSRKVHPLPDVGTGFGLFQEALDFRRLDSSRPTKVHDVAGELAKGEK